MTRSFGIALVLSLLVHLPARAAEAPAAPAPAQAPAAVKPQATELARLMVTKEDWSRGMEMIAKSSQGQMQGHPGSKLTFPPDFGAKVRAEVDKVLPYEELLGLHARELSALYTEKELVDLVAFHRSPLGQKYLKVSPEEAEKVAMQMQQRFQQKMPEIMQRLSAGLKHPEAKPAEPKPADKAPAAPAK
jgi:hypothetical protein